MKFVLTSAGISNKSIEKELINIIGRNLKGLKMLFCTTASNYEGGEMNEWLIEDLMRLKNLGFKIDICDINGIDKKYFLPRFEWADVYYFEGGNTQWLGECIRKSGLEKHLNELLKTRVWIGASAGSCILSPTLCNSCQDLFDENIKGYSTEGLNFVNFQFIPHLNNDWFPKITQENLQGASGKLEKFDGEMLYAIDDEGAVFVDNENVKVVSEGKWFEVKV